MALTLDEATRILKMLEISTKRVKTTRDAFPDLVMSLAAPYEEEYRSLTEERLKERELELARERAIKSIQRHEYTVSRYGLTTDEYLEMLTEQNGVCDICGCASERRLCVDHDHETGQVRALLCDACNKALGLFKDNIGTLARAIEYLNYHANGTE